MTPPLNQAASKIKTMQYALQIVENNQAIVSKMKKSTLLEKQLSVNMIIVLIRKLPICINWCLLMRSQRHLYTSKFCNKTLHEAVFGATKTFERARLTKRCLLKFDPK